VANRSQSEVFVDDKQQDTSRLFVEERSRFPVVAISVPANYAGYADAASHAESILDEEGGQTGRRAVGIDEASDETGVSTKFGRSSWQQRYIVWTHGKPSRECTGLASWPQAWNIPMVGGGIAPDASFADAVPHPRSATLPTVLQRKVQPLAAPLGVGAFWNASPRTRCVPPGWARQPATEAWLEGARSGHSDQRWQRG
jgi:hypothetical protein